MSYDSDIPRKGQVGTMFQDTVDERVPPVTGDYEPVDLTDASEVFIDLLKPDQRTIVTLTGFVYGTATNGVVRAIDSTGVLDAVGDWHHRARANFDDGSKYPGSWTLFEVGT